MIEIHVQSHRGDFTLAANFTGDEGVTALFGPSGAGKSTVIAMIAGLIEPDQGRIVLKDRVLFDRATGIHVPPHRRRIAVVFQEDRLFPHLTVEQNLTYGRWFASGQGPSLAKVVQLLDLKTLLRRHPATLSGGEKQRIALGRALLSAPRLLVLDEPLSSLDAKRRHEILPYLERLRDQRHLPMIYVSHTVEEVVRLADRVVAIDAGKIIATGSVETVLNDPALWPILGEQDAGSILPARIAKHDGDRGLTYLSMAGTSAEETLVIPLIDAAVGAGVRLRVLARDVAIATEMPHHISIRNILRGTIAVLESRTATTTEVTIALSPEIKIAARITKASADDLALHRGQPVFALLKAVAVDRRLPP
ncbi:MAG: molybdenum ABC transporter ATP-binding protein [Alphaproteobacteria bacterium]